MKRHSFMAALAAAALLITSQVDARSGFSSSRSSSFSSSRSYTAPSYKAPSYKAPAPTYKAPSSSYSAPSSTSRSSSSYSSTSKSASPSTTESKASSGFSISPKTGAVAGGVAAGAVGASAVGGALYSSGANHEAVKSYESSNSKATSSSAPTASMSKGSTNSYAESGNARPVDAKASPAQAASTTQPQVVVVPSSRSPGLLEGLMFYELGQRSAERSAQHSSSNRNQDAQDERETTPVSEASTTASDSVAPVSTGTTTRKDAGGSSIANIVNGQEATTIVDLLGTLIQILMFISVVYVLFRVMSRKMNEDNIAPPRRPREPNYKL